ncbi:MAG: MBL fold metallo-hydrolase [Ferruginibacter sp.]
MNIRYNGHASFTFTKDGFSTTLDPWVNSAFFGSWNPFPDNASCKEHILKSDAILMSHEHEDHCDLELLKEFKGEIYIPKYRSDSFCKKLAASGIHYTELKPRHKHRLGPFDIEFVIQSAPAWDDAAIIISLGDNTFIDLNDLKPSVDDLEHIKKTYPAPTFLAYQYSGASWHPMTNKDLTEFEKREISQEKIQRKFRNTLSLMEEFKPSFVLPSAGPPCFLFDEHINFNNGTTAAFPGLKEYKTFLEQHEVEPNALYMQPGDIISAEGEDIICREELYTAQHLPSRMKSIVGLKQKKNVHSYYDEAVLTKLLPDDDIVAYFQTIFKNSAPFKNLLRYLVHYEIISSGNNHTIFVDFRKGTVSFNEPETDILIGYKLTIPAGPFNRIIRGQNSWEELFLSLQFEMHQYLPQHDDHFFTLHKFCHTEYLQRYFAYYKKSLKTETFMLEYEDEKYEVQRFCPHAMADLSKGEIVDGKLICPNHGWAFCLKDGSSTTSNLCIEVKKTGSCIPLV